MISPAWANLPADREVSGWRTFASIFADTLTAVDVSGRSPRKVQGSVLKIRSWILPGTLEYS